MCNFFLLPLFWYIIYRNQTVYSKDFESHFLKLQFHWTVNYGFYMLVHLEGLLIFRALFSIPLPSHQNYTLLNLHHCISAIYCKKQSYCYSEKKADSYFWKAAATVYENSWALFFFLIHSLEIRFWNLSLSVGNETTSLLPRELARNCTGYAVRNHWLPWCDLVGSPFSQTLELINFRTGILQRSQQFPFLYTDILISEVSSPPSW